VQKEQHDLVMETSSSSSSVFTISKERLRSEQEENANAIAKIYASYCKDAREAALALGLQDEKEAIRAASSIGKARKKSSRVGIAESKVIISVNSLLDDDDDDDDDEEEEEEESNDYGPVRSDDAGPDDWSTYTLPPSDIYLSSKKAPTITSDLTATTISEMTEMEVDSPSVGNDNDVGIRIESATRDVPRRINSGLGTTPRTRDPIQRQIGRSVTFEDEDDYSKRSNSIACSDRSNSIQYSRSRKSSLEVPKSSPQSSLWIAPSWPSFSSCMTLMCAF